MIIKLTGFNGNFYSKISENLALQNIETTSDNKFDFEVIVDPNLESIRHPKKTIIALVEPQVVRPDLYNEKKWKKFAGIFPLSSYRAQRLGFSEWFQFPVELPKYVRDDRPRLSRIAIVNEHKFSGSSRSQYGLRRKVIRHFEENFPTELKVFGIEWSKGRMIETRRRLFAFNQHTRTSEFSAKEAFSDLWHQYKNIAGHMHEDLEELQSFQISVVVENDLDYVSEKVWKSIYSGAVPVYVGPKLTNDIELESVVLPSEPNLGSIIKKINEYDSHTISKIRNDGYAFLQGINSSKYGVNLCAQNFVTSLNRLISNL